MDKFYTGVGSRITPLEICQKMTKIAVIMATQGWVLRSGHADGADKAFEAGCDEVSGLKEIYLPWRFFNGSDSSLYETPEKAFGIAEKYHPAWENCSIYARKLHARNVCQVLGKDLQTPSDLLICWTENGEIKGGTATAIRIALDHNIKVENLYV